MTNAHVLPPPAVIAEIVRTLRACLLLTVFFFASAATAAPTDAQLARGIEQDILALRLIASERDRLNDPDFAAEAKHLFETQLQTVLAPVSESRRGAIRARANAAVDRIMATRTRTTPWFQGWPDPDRLREDIEARGRGESDLVIAARQAGRFRGFADAMLALEDTPAARDIPDDARALFTLYRIHNGAIVSQWEPRLEPPERGCWTWSRIECRRATFYNVLDQYALDEAPTREAADLYFTGPVKAAFLGVALRPGRVTDLEGDRGFRKIGGDNPVGSVLLLLLFGGLGIGLLWLLIRGMRQQPAKPRALSDNFGTARYASVQRDIPSQLTPFQGVFLGKSSAPDEPPATPAAPIYTTPQHHTLVLARTRTGKGTRIIVPTLLRYADSMVVIDPKGENAAVTARPRRDDLSQAVHIINPWGELASDFKKRGFESATYNPLDVLDRSDPNVVAIAQSLAATICTSANERDSYWTGSAAAVLAAVFLWIADEPGEEKTLARARAIVSLSRKDFTERYLVKMAASSAFHGAISEMASPFVDLAEETYSGIMSNLSEATRFISDPQLKAATATSSFRMTDLITARTTVYLVIPPDRMALQGTWLRIVLAAAMHTFKRTKRGEGAPRCMFLIDEFPALGRLDDIPRDIAVMSGHGLDFTLIVQGLDQLKHHYGAAHQTILNNCAYKWFCNVSDLDTAKYLSESLGKKTVGTRSEGSSTGPGGGSESVSLSETGRDLLTPDEVLNLGRDVAIALNPDDHPHYLRPVDYWKLPATFGHLAETSMRLVFEPPLRYDDNPYIQPKQPPKPGDGRMTRAEALAVFGLKEGADAATIRAAYKRLMGQAHPDKGGSSWMAQKLNEARDVLK